MIILIDQDGPLADFEQGIVDEYCRRFPGEFFVPIEDRKNFYARLDYPKELRSRIDEIQHSPDFCLNLVPTEGSTEALNGMLSLGHDVRICTSPFTRYEFCVREKYQWVERYFGKEFVRRIILTKDKTLVKGHFLIDDKAIIEGIALAEWEHILFDSPTNRHVINKKHLTWKNWKEVLDLQTATPI